MRNYSAKPTRQRLLNPRLMPIATLLLITGITSSCSLFHQFPLYKPIVMIPSGRQVACPWDQRQACVTIYRQSLDDLIHQLEAACLALGHAEGDCVAK